MRLDNFQWSRNPRGLHVQRAFITPLDYKRWSDPKFGWVKLVAGADEYINDAMDFMALGITPVVRVYWPRPGAQPMTSQQRDLFIAYARAGVKWFELWNEPNLGIEWPEGWPEPDWRDTNGMIAPLMENWLNWAEFILSLGCYPGFISLAESDNPKFSAVGWMDAFLNYLAAYHRDRFRNILASGMYVATHPYILNHYYQQAGGPLTPRPPEAQRAQEGGWHFEYPYDPISQNADPGRTVYGGTPLTPNGDPNGLIAMGRMFNERAARLFGSQAVPVLGTEGGIWDFPSPDGAPFQQDTRYPPYTHSSHAEATVAMFEWIAREAPPWFFGVTLWKEDDYYDRFRARAIDRLTEIAPVYKSVPPIEVMGTGYAPPEAIPQLGPGPIHGQASFHMVLLAPGLTPDWFFETAQPYWNTFRPIVTNRIDFIRFIPYTQSLAITVIATPDMVDTMSQMIQDQYPNVWFDLIVADNLNTVAEVFNNRVLVNQRFG